MKRPVTIPGTSRQSVSSADGAALERRYVYLPAYIWERLHSSARLTGTSVSQLIATFAVQGNANSRTTHDRDKRDR